MSKLRGLVQLAKEAKNLKKQTKEVFEGTGQQEFTNKKSI